MAKWSLLCQNGVQILKHREKCTKGAITYDPMTSLCTYD